MTNFLYKLKRQVSRLSLALLSAACLYGMTGLVAVNAGIWPNLDSELCMADAYLLEPGNRLAQDALNCTANDVEITQVTPVNSAEECTLGETFTFPANVTVRTNANERWDTTFYLPLTEQSPQVVHNPVGNDCSIILPIPADSGETADVQLDGDVCGDITKAHGPDEYTLMNQPITMICLDEDEDNRADFTYCAAWDNIERDNCSLGGDYPGQIPNNKSKCNCDTFNIDVFITPDPPTPEKSRVGTNTHPEPGGVYTFNYSFTNPSSASSLFITSLTDYVDEGANDSYESTINLWGTPVSAGSSDGVYLTATNCAQPADIGNGAGEILPSATYSCQFTVHIVDSDLPNDQSPELYDDVINAVLEDKNGSDVGDGGNCPSSLSLSDGDNCSDVEQVQVTNIPPAISVLKTVNPDSILETTTGTMVTYTVKITNTSLFDSVTITEIKDAVDYGSGYGTPVNLAGDGDCQLTTVLAKDAWCDFTYQASLTGDTGDTITNKATVKAIDNENDEASNMDVATVTFTNSPGMIKLLKTANPTSVTESGANVVFTFNIENTSAVDDLTLTELDDDMFGIIFNNVIFRADSGQTSCDFYGDVLAPGETRECTISEFLSGEPGSGNEHTNIGTVKATTGDTILCPADPPTYPEAYECAEEVMDSDPATVSFIDEPADATLAVNISATVFVTISNGSSYESVNLTELKIQGLNIATASTTHYNLLNTGGIFDSDNFGSCGQPSEGTPIVIAASGSYSCAFTVEVLTDGNSGTNIFSVMNTGAGLSIKVTDDDGGAASESSVNATVQLVPNF